MAEQNLLQSSESPPAQPAYILRGHSAQIHAVHFYRGNSRLLTGDAGGWVVLWSTSSKRAVAVWKPHTNTILGVGNWGEDKLITHARDNKIHVWQLREEDGKDFTTVLPIDSAASSKHKQPWLLHTVPVNALNFCSFSMIHAQTEGTHDIPTNGVLLGTPGLQDGSVNITSLPEEGRVATIPKPTNIENAGMIMAIGLTFVMKDTSSTKDLLVLTGYESGHACVWKQPSSGASNKKWQCIYSVKSHAQPILSLGVAAKMGVFFTSGADAIVARHPLTSDSALETKSLQSKHAGQQGLTLRNDEKIFATAGWDGRMRVYSTKSMKELAVLKWHKEGCYAIAFANVEDSASDVEQQANVAVSSQKSMTVAEKREEKARTTHWLAAGSKDGKVSLWDIY